jgi:hypothetical protein
MMARHGKQSRSGKRTHPTTSGNGGNKIALPMKYEDAVSAFLKVKPEPKKQQPKKRSKSR